MKQIQIIDRSYTIELPILSNTNSKINFGDNETLLDNVQITGVSLLPGSIGTAPSGRTMLPTLNAMQGMITFADNNRVEYNKQLPLELLLRTDGSIIQIEPKQLSIRNTYVDFPLISTWAIPGGAIPGYALVFVFFYKPIN